MANIQPHLFTPAPSNPIRDATDAPAAVGQLRGILVVDDDALLLTLLNLALQKHGFTVWLAADGFKALEVYQQHRAQIQVVLLDVRMPGMDGPRTLTELQRINAGLVCCFMSGHTGQYTPTELLGRGAHYLFDKPFRIEEIVRVLDDLATPKGERTATSA